jgi:hypothetical protein
VIKETKETKDTKETKEAKEAEETKEAEEPTSQRAIEFAELAAAFVFTATDLPSNFSKRACRKAS